MAFVGKYRQSFWWVAHLVIFAEGQGGGCSHPPSYLKQEVYWWTELKTFLACPIQVILGRNSDSLLKNVCIPGAVNQNGTTRHLATCVRTTLSEYAIPSRVELPALMALRQKS